MPHDRGAGGQARPPLRARPRGARDHAPPGTRGPDRVGRRGALGAGTARAGIAAAFIGVWRMRVTPPPASAPDSALHGFQFVLVEPRAAKVSLVGDFNDWDATRTPMHRTSRDGLWSAVVSLQPGRYRYAFLIDGRHWLADPAAPTAGDDDYGAPSSVVTVGGGGS